MTVIRFPDRQKLATAEVQNRAFSGLSETKKEQAQVAEPLQRSRRTEYAGDNEAVRHFALMIADKLLRDPELNHAAPFMVDKIIRMLVIASHDL
ncbi:hypothetical protein [Franconibacter daqui]|uniref:Uncharacterized protein n=1 Tax=Franconibacter daqui TaxID=2047724 RepID=A0ABV1PSH7_9ENTR